MKLSIAMAYYNRIHLLSKTLESIKLSALDRGLFEVVICDDASNEENEITESFIKKFDLNIKVVRINKENKHWKNPCVATNIALANCVGDTVIIQNPENIHLNDVPMYCLANIDDNRYISLHCYSACSQSTNKIFSTNITHYSDIVKQLIPFKECGEIGEVADADCWYNHIHYRPCAYHFCSAITRKDLYSMGGFDLRYKDMPNWDDNEFLLRIQRKKMNIVFANPNYMVCHMFHGTNKDNHTELLSGKNYEMYLDDMKNDRGYMALETNIKPL